jgi:hypothetical protein
MFTGGGSWTKDLPKFVRLAQRERPELVQSVQLSKPRMAASLLEHLFSSLLGKTVSLSGANRKQIANLASLLKSAG